MNPCPILIDTQYFCPEVCPPSNRARYLREVDRLGPRLEAHALEDAAGLLGRRLESPAEADAALERLVAEAGPERDEALLAFFYRQCLREEAMLRPAMRELTDRALQPICL